MPTLLDAIIAALGAPLIALTVAAVRRIVPSAVREDALKESASLLAFLDAWVKVPRSNPKLKEEAEAAAHKQLMGVLSFTTEQFYCQGSQRSKSVRWLILRPPRTPLLWLPRLGFYFSLILTILVLAGWVRGASVPSAHVLFWLLAILATAALFVALVIRLERPRQPT